RPSSSTALCLPSSSALTRTRCSGGSTHARQVLASVSPPATPCLPVTPPQRIAPGRRWYLPFYQLQIAAYMYTAISIIINQLSNALYHCICICDHFFTAAGKLQVQSWQASQVQHHQPRVRDGGAAEEQGQGETRSQE